MTDNFDGWLKGEFARKYVSFGAAALPAGAPYRSRASSGGSRLFGSLASRALVIAAVTVAGLATTCVLAAAAATRSADPLVWSQHLVNAVATCGAQNGAGQCVNAIVRPRRKTLGKPIGGNTPPTPQGHQPGGKPDGGPNGVANGDPTGGHGKPSPKPAAAHSPQGRP